MLAAPVWINDGSSYLQWVTSMVTFAGWAWVAWRDWHGRCVYCRPPIYRMGQVPIPGTPHKACKRHAVEHGHSH